MGLNQPELPAYGNLCILRYAFHLAIILVSDSLQYLPTATLAAGVKAGELHQGYFNANQYNYLEVRASVSVLHMMLTSSIGQFTCTCF
jgi:hypothetical protein